MTKMRRLYLGHAQEFIGILARAPGGQMRGAETQAMRCSSSRSGNEAAKCQVILAHALSSRLAA